MNQQLLPIYLPHLESRSLPIYSFFIAVIFVPVISVIIIQLASKFNFKRMKVAADWLLVAISAYIIFNSVIALKIYPETGVNKSFLANNFLLGLFLTSILLLTLASFFFKSKLHLKQIKITPGKKRFISTIFAISLIIFVLCDRTVSEDKIFSGTTFQYLHSSVFVGPVHNILHGKTLLVNADSQYGILINYLPVFIFKYIIPQTPLSFTSFFHLMVVYGIVYYFCLYFILELRFKNSFWIFTGLVCLFSLHFYLSIFRYLRPMTFPIRYFLDVPFFLLLLLTNVKKIRFRNLLLSLFLGLAVFYNFETGISLSVAYLVFEFLENTRIKNITSGFVGTAKSLITIGLSLTLIWVLYSLLVKSQTGYFPDYVHSLFFLKLFAEGFLSGGGMLLGFYLFPLFIYLVFIVRTLFSLLKRNYPSNFAWDGALTAYGLMIFIYYIERPYIVNLPPLAIPAIILGIILFKEVSLKRLLGPYLVLGSFVCFSFLYFPYRFLNNSRYEYWIKDSEYPAKLYNDITKSADFIKENSMESKSVALFSYYDTIILLKSGKTNSIPYSDTFSIYTKDQEEKIRKELISQNPPYLFIDSNHLVTENIYTSVFKYIDSNYRYKNSKGTLDLWEKK